jgi:predicted membrane protein
MGDQFREKDKPGQYVEEWSFSFADLLDWIRKFVQSLGSKGDESIRTSIFNEPVGTATSASIRLDLPVCQANIKAATSDNLIDATLTHVGDVKFAVTGDQQKVVHLSQEDPASNWTRYMFTWFGTEGRLKWNIDLTPRVPLALDINNGVGESIFDLSDLNITELDLNGGVGKIDVVLPSTGNRYPAVVSSGVGKTSVTIAPNAAVDLKIRAGVGEVDLKIGENADVIANLRGGVGQTNILIPYGAAVRLEASLGPGSVDVPSSYTRIKGGDDEFLSINGVWQTPNYEGAVTRILIRFQGGVGSLQIR